MLQPVGHQRQQQIQLGVVEHVVLTLADFKALDHDIAQFMLYHLQPLKEIVVSRTQSHLEKTFTKVLYLSPTAWLHADQFDIRSPGYLLQAANNEGFHLLDRQTRHITVQFVRQAIDFVFDSFQLSIKAIAGDVVALVHSLGLSSVVLNGWSLGGAVAVEAATQLGDTCAALVLTGGATPVYTQKPDFPHGGTEEDMAGTLAALAADRVNFLEGLSKVVCVKEVSPNIEHWFWQIFLQASPLAGASLGELATLDQREQLAALELPILSFVGSEDGFVAPPICRWVGDHCKNATVVEFEGVGHAPFIEAQQDYFDALVDFVTRLP